jgi:protein-disulfide isomerase
MEPIAMTFALSALMLAAQLSATEINRPAPPPEAIHIVLYSDFQCPFCASFAPTIRRLQRESIDGVNTTIEFKNFPLSFHPNAQLAHRAAMAAKAQGKFWEMHDLLFANQRSVQRSDLVGYAKELGLDLARFERDLDSDHTKQLIAAEVAEGNRLGITGTPTYVVNGRRYTGTRPFEQLKGAIVKEAGRARALAEITDDLTSEGPSSAPVTVQLFLDLQSPVSPPTLEVVNQLLKRYPSTVRVEFRNFPLAFHPDARLVHEAAMTAARDGHFWEFANFILRHQSSLREQDLIAYAGTLGLDEAKFAETIGQHRYAPRVDADLQAGQNRELRGSPVVLVNGKQIDGVPSLATLVEYVEASLQAEPGSASHKR